MNPDPPHADGGTESPAGPAQPIDGQGPTQDLAVGPALSVGSMFGGYRIEGLLGYGGAGIVYRARQNRPDREVALKVIRPGAATLQGLKRLELEAEVLGRLQHPGIAQVYEAGTADSPIGKQPFFAMELVTGDSLTAFATKNQLGTRQRLELFAKVCEAVQHAHSKGIIHRDLKPSNILVTAEGQPKVLDFGVARVTDHDVQLTTIHTNIGQLIGTVPYMSPEQVAGDSLSLDTRSDVYALGVILYELLTGRMPYDLSKKLIHEAARIICEDEPTSLSSIDRMLRGDVETIVAKAMEKEKVRRYQTASDLGGDVSRFLRDEPISARPASAAYQFRKFASRNKALAVFLIGTFVVLSLGLVVTSVNAVFLYQAKHKQMTAMESERQQRMNALASAARSKIDAERANRERDEAAKSRAAEEAQRMIAYEQRDRAVVAEEEQKKLTRGILNWVEGSDFRKMRDQGKIIHTAPVMAFAESFALKAATHSIRFQLAPIILNIGVARARIGEFSSAEANLLEAQPMFIQTRGPAAERTQACMRELVDLYIAWDAAEPGKGYDMNAAEWQARLDAIATPEKPAQ